MDLLKLLRCAVAGNVNNRAQRFVAGFDIGIEAEKATQVQLSGRCDFQSRQCDAVERGSRHIAQALSAAISNYCGLAEVFSLSNSNGSSALMVNRRLIFSPPSL